MDLISILTLLTVAALGWYWFDSLRALEIARSIGKRTCNEAEVQLLDDTVARISIALVRNEQGRRVLRRTYRFEYSDSGNNRREGRLILLGETCETVSMYPFQVVH